MSICSLRFSNFQCAQISIWINLRLSPSLFHSVCFVLFHFVACRLVVCLEMYAKIIQNKSVMFHSNYHNASILRRMFLFRERAKHKRFGMRWVGLSANPVIQNASSIGQQRSVGLPGGDPNVAYCFSALFSTGERTQHRITQQSTASHSAGYSLQSLHSRKFNKKLNGKKLRNTGIPRTWSEVNKMNVTVDQIPNVWNWLIGIPSSLIRWIFFFIHFFLFHLAQLKHKRVHILMKHLNWNLIETLLNKRKENSLQWKTNELNFLNIFQYIRISIHSNSHSLWLGRLLCPSLHTPRRIVGSTSAAAATAAGSVQFSSVHLNEIALLSSLRTYMAKSR